VIVQRETEEIFFVEIDRRAEEEKEKEALSKKNAQIEKAQVKTPQVFQKNLEVKEPIARGQVRLTSSADQEVPREDISQEREVISQGNVPMKKMEEREERGLSSPKTPGGFTNSISNIIKEVPGIREEDETRKKKEENDFAEGAIRFETAQESDFDKINENGESEMNFLEKEELKKREVSDPKKEEINQKKQGVLESQNVVDLTKIS